MSKIIENHMEKVRGSDVRLIKRKELELGKFSKKYNNNKSNMYKVRLDLLKIKEDLKEIAHKIVKYSINYPVYISFCEDVFEIINKTFMIGTDSDKKSIGIINNLIFLEMNRYLHIYTEQGLSKKTEKQFNNLLGSYVYLISDSDNPMDILMDAFEDLKVKNINHGSIIRKLLRIDTNILELVFTNDEIKMLEDYRDMSNLLTEEQKLQEILEDSVLNYFVGNNTMKVLNYIDSSYYSELISITVTMFGDKQDLLLSKDIYDYVYSYFFVRDFEIVSFKSINNKLKIKVLTKDYSVEHYKNLNDTLIDLFNFSENIDSTVLISGEIFDLIENKTVENLTIYNE